MKKNTIIGGAIILTAAGFITRILGFIYRIYISNLIGSEGMGLFQLIFPVYMLALTICSSGSFVSISKLVAEENAKKQLGNMRKVLKIGCSISLILSMLIGIIIFSSSNFIGTKLLHDSRTCLAIKVLSFGIPFSVLNSCIKAYFYGTKKMIVPATSQVLEQITRMTTIFLISGFFIPKGLTYACVMTMIGTIVGDSVSFIHVFTTYKCSKNNEKNYIKRASKKTVTLLSSIFAIAIPITANRTITNVLSSYESIIIPTQLQTFGMNNSEAMSLYGQLTGMALPLIFFPSLLTNALSMSLLPTVSEATAINNTRRINNTVSKSLHFTSIIGIGSTCLFITFGHQLGLALYNEPNVGHILFMLSFLCPFIYMQSTFSGILNGLGLQNTAFINNLIGITIRIMSILFFVPKKGINAYLVGFLISVIIVSILNLTKVLKVAILSFNFKNWLIKPTLAAIGAGLSSTYISKHFIFPCFNMQIGLVISLLILFVIYLFFIILLKCITKSDLKLIKNGI